MISSNEKIKKYGFRFLHPHDIKPGTEIYMGLISGGKEAELTTVGEFPYTILRITLSGDILMRYRDKRCLFPGWAFRDSEKTRKRLTYLRFLVKLEDDPVVSVLSKPSRRI